MRTSGEFNRAMNPWSARQEVGHRRVRQSNDSVAGLTRRWKLEMLNRAMTQFRPSCPPWKSRAPPSTYEELEKHDQVLD